MKIWTWNYKSGIPSSGEISGLQVFDDWVMHTLTYIQAQTQIISIQGSTSYPVSQCFWPAFETSYCVRQGHLWWHTFSRYNLSFLFFYIAVVPACPTYIPSEIPQLTFDGWARLYHSCLFDFLTSTHGCILACFTSHFVILSYFFYFLGDCKVSSCQVSQYRMHL